jgi:beta-1,4-mannosyl-glycoprotein beta-1,4-N-acetylglucosaminyltransferase
MIYDAFIMRDELDLLEFRLGILNEVVDRFVIVEATRDFHGRSKDQYFSFDSPAIKPYADKIEYVLVKDMPDDPDIWAREHHQRNCILRGLANAQPDDWILLSDVDEIPSPKAIKASAYSNAITMFVQPLFYYYVNCACNELGHLPWTAGILKKLLDSPQQLRDKIVNVHQVILGGGAVRSTREYTLVDPGGWHFSYLGGIDQVIRKIPTLIDPEYGKAVYHNRDKIEAAFRSRTDPFGRKLTFTILPVDDKLPGYLLANRRRFAHFIAPDDRKDMT